MIDLKRIRISVFGLVFLVLSIVPAVVQADVSRCLPDWRSSRHPRIRRTDCGAVGV